MNVVSIPKFTFVLSAALAVANSACTSVGRSSTPVPLNESNLAAPPTPQVTVVPAPTAVLIDLKDLPALPAELTLLSSDIETQTTSIQRWARNGGTLQTIYALGPNDGDLCDLALNPETGTLLLAIVDGGSIRCRDARLVAIRTPGARPIEIPTEGTLVALALSPDDRYVAYASLDSVNGQIPISQEPARRDWPTTLYVVDTEAENAVRVLARCHDTTNSPFRPLLSCVGYPLVFDPHGRRLAFADGEGAWIADISGSGLRRIVGVQVPKRDVDGEWLGPFRPTGWSPDGAYLVASADSINGEVPVVIEVETGAVTELPGAVEYDVPYTQVEWSRDGVFAFVSHWYQSPVTPHVLNRYRVEELDEPEPLLAALPPSPISYSAFGLAVAPDGTIRFGLRQPRPAGVEGSGVFRSAADGSNRVRLAAMPAKQNARSIPGEEESLRWSPDAVAFLLQFEDGADLRTIVGSSDGRTLLDASALRTYGPVVGWSR